MSRTIRTFIGAPLPEAYRARLRELQDWLRPRLRSRLSFTRPESWHLTLRFLGDTDEELAREGLPVALGEIAFEPFELQAGGGGFFPPRGVGRWRPRVAWVGLVRGAEACRALAAAVSSAVAPLGFPPEDRPYSPHLTLARIKRAEDDRWDDALAHMDKQQWPPVAVERIVLWRSELTAAGPKHTALAEFPAR